ncbi:hypothetical protein D3C86_2154090 [compost metagenome]
MFAVRVPELIVRLPVTVESLIGLTVPLETVDDTWPKVAASCLFEILSAEPVPVRSISLAVNKPAALLKNFAPELLPILSP